MNTTRGFMIHLILNVNNTKYILGKEYQIFKTIVTANK